MLKWYKADLHIHTVLSPCAQLSMGPRDIVQMAIEKQLDMIAITDHNSAENAEAVIGAARGTNLTVIPGMEVCSREGIHLICLFPNLVSINSFQDFVYASLPEGENDESFFGSQIVCDKDENILYHNKKLLAFSIDKSIDQVVLQVHSKGGIVYPAHVNRKAYGILSVMGFIPSNLAFQAIEFSFNRTGAEPDNYLKAKYTIIASSDAHDLKDIGKNRTYFKMARPDFNELKLAIERKEGRETCLESCESEIYQA